MSILLTYYLLQCLLLLTEVVSLTHESVSNFDINDAEPAVTFTVEFVY
jgi:hypothetical protein